MRVCASCGSSTGNPCRVCDDCIAMRVATSLAEQGLPRVPSVETMERLGLVLARPVVKAVA